MEYLPLSRAIAAICSPGKIHVCIHDVSGILKNPHLSIDYSNATHSIQFCNLAKSTEKGFALCMKCKNCCNRKAILKQREFSGLCAFGLYESVKPVIIDGKTVCIIYLGNVVTDMRKTTQKLKSACLYTGAPFDKLKECLKNCDNSSSSENLSQICMLIDSYIKMLYEKYKDKADTLESPYHWAVYNIKKYADENYGRSFTLEELCKLYFVNEKYAGRLFAKQVGLNFHEYLNKIRLEKAAEMLASTDEKIIDIALICGYGDVTYFNRKFREKYHSSPGSFRKNSKNQGVFQ